VSDAADLRVSMTGTGTLLGTALTVKSGSTCSVNVNDQTITVQVARDLTVAVGDVLLVAKVGSQWFAVARCFAAAPANPGNVSIAPSPIGTSGTTNFAPIETRTYRNSVWRSDTTDLAQGLQGSAPNSTGAAFYGTAARSLAGAIVTGASIQVRRQASIGDQTPLLTTLNLVTENARPVGAPTLTSSTNGPSLAPGEQQTFTIPTSWAQAIVDGTAGGLAIYTAGGTPYVVLDGNGTWSPSFTLTIYWQR
jgi:hypothetical protein